MTLLVWFDVGVVAMTLRKPTPLQVRRGFAQGKIIHDLSRAGKVGSDAAKRDFTGKVACAAGAVGQHQRAGAVHARDRAVDAGAVG